MLKNNFHLDPRLHIYIYIYEEMVDLGKSDKMIKISRKVDKPNTEKMFVQLTSTRKVFLETQHSLPRAKFVLTN